MTPDEQSRIANAAASLCQLVETHGPIMFDVDDYAALVLGRDACRPKSIHVDDTPDGLATRKSFVEFLSHLKSEVLEIGDYVFTYVGYTVVNTVTGELAMVDIESDYDEIEEPNRIGAWATIVKMPTKYYVLPL